MDASRERPGAPDAGRPNRSWMVLAVGFGLLVVLIAFSGFTVLRRADEIHAGITALRDEDHRTEELLGRVRSDLQLSAISVRDFLIDPSSGSAASRAELSRLQKSTTEAITQLQPLTEPGDAARFARMRSQVTVYWHSLDPLFDWTPAQRATGSALFLRREVLPRRQAALDLVREIEELTAGGIQRRSEEIERRQAELPVYVERTIGGTIAVGILIAVVSILRIVGLEKVAAQQHAKVRETEQQLRQLSRQLVSTQEEERRSLSRELHDQIGQLLTAARIGIGNIEDTLGPGPEGIRRQIEQTRRIVEQTIRSVRDLAMGLRPSMLDDLGLGPALEWQARQHARLCGVPVSIHLDGALEDLSDDERTCIYRVVQEALNNAAKHAAARTIEIEMSRAGGLLTILIRDNGRGFDVHRYSGKGLGIIGMKERVRQLGGQITVESAPGEGTTLTAVIPLASPNAAETDVVARERVPA